MKPFLTLRQDILHGLLSVWRPVLFVLVNPASASTFADAQFFKV
jgi:hypothetical protein